MTKIELAQLSGNPVDDTFAISAGTGVRLNTQSITLSAQSDTLRVTKGITPPATPVANDLWISTSLADMIPATSTERVKLLAGTQAWESGLLQEANFWFDGTNWNVLYTGGIAPLAGLGWATCPGASDPLVPSNWTKYAGNPVLGLGNGGRAGMTAHSGIFYESGTLYVYYPDIGGISQLVMQSGSDPIHLGSPSAGFGYNGLNFRVTKLGPSSYAAGYTASVNFESSFIWQGFVSTATSPTGPWTRANSGNPMVSLNPVPNAGGTDGPNMVVEGSNIVAWYHSAALAYVAPTDIWRATIPISDITTDTWTILDNKAPVVIRAAQWEVDQVADVQLQQSTNGTWWAAWDGYDNVANKSSIGASPLSPVIKRWTGQRWVAPARPPQREYLPGISSNEFFGMGAGTYVTPDFLNAGGSRGAVNAGFGARALGQVTTGSQNTAIGAGTAQTLTTADDNTAVGFQALKLATGASNTAIGSSTMRAATTATNNTVVGFQSGIALTTASQTTAVGVSTGFALTTGANNSLFGYNAGSNLTTGASNVAVGTQAMVAQTTASSNVAVGSNSLNANVTGVSLVAVGDHALFTATGSSSTAVGNAAGQGITTGQRDVAIGAGTMGTAGNITNDSTAVGYQALKVQTGGNNDTAVGSGAMIALTTGTSNTAVGQGALAAMLSNNSSTAVGQGSLSAATGGSNTSVGAASGTGIVLGTTNTIIGFNAGNTDGTTTTSDQSNITLLGERAQATTSDVIVLGKAVNTRPNLIFGGVGATAAFGSGVGVFAIANAITAPTTNPTGGGVLYVSAGALKWRGSAGTITTIANA